METNEYDRRKYDARFAEFMGEIREWKDETARWRNETDKKLKEIMEFMDEVRAPRKLIVWTVRAIAISAVGSIAAALVGFLRGHIRWG